MGEHDRAGDGTFVARRDADVGEVVAALRQLVRTDERTQRSIETENAFQQGYLSQVLQGHISLSVRHLLGILSSLDIAPAEFFAQLEVPTEGDSIPILSEIRERMARYDAALEELAEKGILGHPGRSRPPTIDS